MTKPRMAAVTVLSLIAYLALAIAGAGGAARFFSYPALIAVTLITIALGFAALFSEELGKKEGKVKEKVVEITRTVLVRKRPT